MNKLIAGVIAAAYLIATGTALAAYVTPSKDVPTIDCKNVKNKDKAACKTSPTTKPQPKTKW